MIEPRSCLLVGLGARVTDALLPAIHEARLPLRIAGVCDPDSGTAARVRALADTGLIPRDVPVFDHLDDALRRAAYDLALLCCSHDEHQAAAMRLLRHDVIVWKEKPFALTLSQALELAASAGMGLRVLTHRPHSQLYAIAEQALQRLGPLRSYRVQITRSTEDYSATWRASRRRSGGGAILDLGYHAFDLIARFASPPSIVFALAAASPAYRPRVEVEETAYLTLSHRDGEVGTVQVSRCDEPLDQVCLVADSGRIVITDDAARVVVEEPGDVRHEVELSSVENPKARMLRYHLETLHDVSLSRAEAKIGVRATAMIEAAYASLRSGQPAAVRADAPAAAVSPLRGVAS